MLKLFSNKYVRYGLIATGGVFIGWLLFHSPHDVRETREVSEQVVAKSVWTCAMHPQIRMDKPGKCPICGMDLIPLNQSGNVQYIDPDAIHLTREAAQLANVQTSVVTREKPVKEVRLYGKVQPDERSIQSQVAHMPGRIEKLMVSFTGEKVNKGQPLAIIFSPELVTAQQELLETATMKSFQPEIYEAARDKLRQWKLTDMQIEEIENSGMAKDNFEILSNTAGIITARRVNTGDHIVPGTVLFDVADLSHVWVLFDAYESDLPFISTGDKLSFTIQALPGAKLSGSVTFIDPVIDPITRVAKVRVEANNESGRLKPEMFAMGIVKANLYQFQDKLVIPRSSVLWTGTRSIVYLRQPGTDELVFRMREVELGPSLGNSYVVINGLNEGDEIVTSGTYSVDASAQLEGKSSMMNSDKPENSTTNKPSEINHNEEFSYELNDVFEQYIVLKNALVESDAVITRVASEKLMETIDKADRELLRDEQQMKWMEFLKNSEEAIKVIRISADLEAQRKAFSGLSDQLYYIIKNIGLTGKTVHYQFCPMANDGKGAYWLSETTDIRNPYFGEKMMDCGETKETLRF